MSIALDSLNVIIPVEKLDRAWPGGFLAFIQANPRCLDWHDGTIACKGAREQKELERIIHFFESLGLKPRLGPGREERWLDLCVIDTARTDQPACDWLSYDPARRCASLKGREGSPVLGPGTCMLCG